MNNTDKDTSPIIITDCYGFIFRAYYSHPKLSNPLGEEVGAIYGFMSMLLKLLIKFHPSKVISVFDGGGKNFRHEIYSEYKMHRPEVPDDLKNQLINIDQVPKALNITTFKKEGYEADDIIASLVKKFGTNNSIIIMSSDKDLMQLVNDNVSMFNPTTNQHIFSKNVEEKFKVPPHQIRDYLSIVGDAADNIPGVKGIGPKGAVKLLQQFHSLANIFDNINSIQGKTKQLLQTSQNEAWMSQKLTTLKDDIQLELEEKDITWTIPDRQQVMTFVDLHDFRSLVPRINSLYNMSSLYTFAENEVQKEIKEYKTTIIQTPKQLKQYLEKSLENGYLSLYVSDTSPQRIFFSTEEQTCAVLNIERKVIPQEMEDVLFNFLKDDSILKITYDLKNLFTLYPSWVNNVAAAEDLLLMRYAINTKNTSNISVIEAIRQTVNIQLQDSHSHMITLFKEAHKILEQQLLSLNTLFLYHELDLPMVKILGEMEQSGILIDVAKLRKLSEELKTEILKLEKCIHDISGADFNISSPKQLSHVLFDVLKLPRGKTLSKSHITSTNVDTLQALSKDGFVIADLILKHRHLTKLKNTYTDAIPQQVDQKTSRVHTTFSQTITNTGRLNSIKPNLQNIPIKTQLGKKIREAFISNKNQYLVKADYSQIELRILSHIADVKAMKEAFSSNVDIHTKTACQIFKVQKNQVSEELRRKGKIINFSIIYGSTSFGLAKQLEVSTTAAKQYIDRYLTEYPEISTYYEQTIAFAERNKFVTSMFNRICSVEQINSTNHHVKNFAKRAAINAPIQSTAADIMKLATIAVSKKLKNLNCKLLLQVHDELIFECDESTLEVCVPIMKNEMENIVKLSVPMVVNISYGNNWKEHLQII
ncbi:DNA polymerase I [Candidatus Sneabacter namystus]|uniref:DNA polymerase I n=1 Tax=Candidatus Sneabacter namystus TaxID=2601646 RepID=A0A5C0UJ63_9RICK|nr:DNA polymerase I [Candidatus Sneabacter namystus]QEK39553.1 DNA polymerase I [Candidatus Sneabacter namystus]